MSTSRKTSLLVLAGGAILAVGWWPTGLAPAMPLGALLLIRGVRRIETGRQVLWCALVAAFAFEGIASHFLLVLMRYSWIGFVVYLMSLAYYVPGWLLLFWGTVKLERWIRLPRPLGLTLLFPLVEKLRTFSDFSFPADLLAHGFGNTPSWLAWTPWIGPFGLSLVIWGVGAMLDQAIERRADRRRALVMAVLALALWLAPPATDRLLNPRPVDAGPPLRVSVVQPCTDVRDKLDPESWPGLWSQLEELTLSAAKGADLVIWPETARPGPIVWRDEDRFRDPEMEALAGRAGVPILYGTEIARVEDDRVTAIYNGAALARPGVAEERWYGKQQLLPFVEGVPFAEVVGWDPSQRQDQKGQRSLLTLMGNFKRGPRPTVFEIGPARIGVLICLESQYPVLGRRFREAGANTLAVLTNDAWWGRSIFASWHAQMVASQARSLDVPILRAANSGVSSLTDRFGRLQAATEIFDVTTLRGTFTPGPDRSTFFSHSGNALLFGILAFVVIFGAVARRR